MSSGTHFEVYDDKAGESRWRLKASNGKIVAESGEGYDSEANCYRALYELRVWVTVAFENLAAAFDDLPLP